MKEILELLQNKINEKFIPLNKDDKVFEFLKEFFNEYKLLNIDTLLDADRARLLTVIVISETKDIDVEEVYKFFQEKEEYLCELSDYKIMNQLSKFILKQDFKNITISIFDTEEFKSQFDADFTDICKFFFKNELEINAFATNVVINIMKKALDDVYDSYNKINKLIQANMSESTKRRHSYNYIKEEYGVEEYLEYLNTARKYYDSKNKNEEKNRKIHNKLIASYKKVYETINKACENNEIIKYDDSFFGSISDYELKMRILKEIYKYNQVIYDKVNKKYNIAIANSVLNFKELLLSYGIIFNEYQLRKITTKDIYDVEEILKYLKVKGFDSPENLSEIILLTDLETVKKYVSLMESGIISKELLINNIELFNKNSNLYINLSKNLEYINERGINPYSFQSSQHVLLLDYNTFKYNIEILDSYNFLNYIKVEDNYTFFEDNNLDLAIDILLELGLEEYLEEDLALLNYSNRFNRLRLLKSLNITISSKEELIKYLVDNKFFVPDSKLDEYIYNSVDYFIDHDNSDYNDLSYYTTPRTYKIGNLIFSKNRVLRNLSLMENNLSEKQRLVHAFLDGAFLTDDELEEFKKIVIRDKRKVLK